MDPLGGKLLPCASLAHKQHRPVYLGYSRETLLEGEKRIGLADGFVNFLATGARARIRLHGILIGHGKKSLLLASPARIYGIIPRTG